MMCAEVREQLPGYLDGAATPGRRGRNHARINNHLAGCQDCRRELERYRRLAILLSSAEHPEPPADLAVRIRVAVSQARASRNLVQRLQTRAVLILENILEPLALPATGGVVAALIVFAVMFPVLLVGVPVGAVPNDLPTNLLQPARLESLAPFSVSVPDDEALTGPHMLLIEATVNAQGEAVRYEILAGPSDLSIRRQLDQVLMFSRFRPQLSFGRPTPGGRVVLSFSEVRVKG